MQGLIMFIPANIDINELSEIGRKCITSFKRDKLVYVLNLLTEIPSNNKDLMLTGGYVPVSSAILKNIIGSSYSDYIQLLLDEGVIESDNQYIVGEKSKGYRFTNKYQVNLISIEITDFALQKKLLSRKRVRSKKNSKEKTIKKSKNSHTFVVPPYDKVYTKGIYKWYNDGGLEIDDKLACSYANTVFEFKKHDQNKWDRDFATSKLIHPFNQHGNMIRNIHRIKNGDFNAHVDNNVHRLHSVLTYSKKDIRHALTYKGENLVAIDLSNSQPYLSTILFKPEFWESKNSTLSIFNLHLPIQSIFPNTSKYNYFIMFLKKLSNLPPEEVPTDLINFIEAVSSGNFYGHFQKMIFERAGRKLDIQKELKPLIFMVLFTGNSFIGQKEAEYKRIFKEAFPTVYEVFSSIKSSKKENLPILLQQIESHIFIKRIGLRMAKEHPNVPFWTIHDSIVTTVSNADFVERIAKEELEICIGLKPTMKREYWEKRFLQKEIRKIKLLKIVGIFGGTMFEMILRKIIE